MTDPPLRVISALKHFSRTLKYGRKGGVVERIIQKPESRSMLTLIALSAVLMQDPPPPPAPDPEEARSSRIVVGGEGGRSWGGREFIIRDGEDGPRVRRFEMRRPMSGDDRDVVVLAEPDGGSEVRRFEFRTPGDGDHVRVLRERVDASGDVRIMRRARPHGGSADTHFEVRTLRDGEGMRGLDTDNDGRISEAEFTAPLRDAFARMDADRSGFVEEGERGHDGAVRVFSERVETPREGDD